MAYVIVFVSLSIAIVAPSVQAHIAVFDDYWTQRQANAAMETTGADNGTRRELGQVKAGQKARGGRFKSLNAIDRCWRGDKNWAKNRKKLADCVLGFGLKTTGGKNGPIYVVTDASDDDLLSPKPGTLRHAVTRDRPLWIIFARTMVIKLQQELMITNDKTIDGRGVSVYITGGAGFTLHLLKEDSVGLIRDSEEHFGLRTISDGDGINIFGATTYGSIMNCSDGMIDAIMGSTAITISNSHFTDHKEVMLFGAKNGDEFDKKMQITVAFNHFGKRLNQRMPRVRYGMVHVVNNDYTHWEMLQREYTAYPEWKSWNWQSERDYFLNGAYFVQSGKSNAWSAAPKNPIPKEFTIRPQPGTKVRSLTKDAGTLDCRPGKSC
ncbi:hypothetical protein HID58_007891 [Brassica napus]|uniref:Pectate lyase n=1 Tax=Brassica napus TaxID=3708 RepID=A0ABQ7XKR4_BRANA|nr:hypothetical protein HID58_007891 [Brassica napus]